MVRKKKDIIVKTQEELQEESLKRNLSFIQKDFIPEPTYFFEVNDKVDYGAWDEAIILDSIDDKKIYKVKLHTIHEEHGELKEQDEIRYIVWTNLRPINNNQESFIKNEDVRLNYSNTFLSDILSKAYTFGIDFDVEYQREYVWDDQDKENLINSIFNNIDIGKFVFMRRDYGQKYLYEPIDGKQRSRAILDFYENRFTYKGKYFNELSKGDQNYFTRFTVNVATVEYISRKQVLKYFIMLNTTGKVMDKEHIEKVKAMLL